MRFRILSPENTSYNDTSGVPNKLPISELLLTSFSNRGQVQNYSYGCKFHLHVKENSLSFEWFCTWPRFKMGAKSNSEMGYRAFSYDVTAAILDFQNKETAVILVYQTNPLGIEPYFLCKHFLLFH